MLSQDDTQKQAELRQAFLRHLPRRVEGLARRGTVMCVSGWDVNQLQVLFREVEDLAGTCGRNALLELATSLSRIEDLLRPAIEQGEPPDTDGSVALATLFAGLNGLVEQLRAKQAESAQAVVVDDRVAVDGAVLQVVPPAEFIARHARPLPSADAPAPAPGDAPDEPAEAGAVAASPAAPATPAMAAPPERVTPTGPRIYHLTDGNPISQDVDQRLTASGYQLESFDDPAEVAEGVAGLPPRLVIVDSGFVQQLEAIGQAVRSVRDRGQARIGLIVLSDTPDIPSRLAAMRAGADTFLPLPATAVEIVGRAQELIAADSSDPFRVMIIEDDRSQALFAESILKKAGMQTTSVIDPLAAMDTLESFDPELILMDLYMPNCDGMELTTMIRERDRFINTPIVFLSGEHDADKRFDALSAGGDDYLEKPIRPKYLISAVTNRVRRARTISQRVKARNPKDPATGLYDRSHLIDRIAYLIASADGGPRAGGALFLAIDGAMSLRDKAGLAVFEAVMAEVGTALAGQLATEEWVTRYGDTSFLILSEKRGDADLVDLARRVQQRFDSQLFEAGSHSASIAACVGIATFAQQWTDANGLLTAAERAANQARADGGKVKMFETQVTAASASGEEQLVETVRDALKRDLFQLVFQPIASLRGAGEEQFQVLLRLRSEGGRMYTGGVLLPAIEQAGIALEVDRWVVARAAMVAQERERQERPLRLFVHQSADTLSDGQRAAWLRQQFETRQIPGERVVLTFRHADLAQRVKQAISFAEQLRPLGVRMAIAGFEASLASFQMLQHLPVVEQIKLAAQYVDADKQTPKLRQELRELVTFAHDRQIRVIAPQVEDAQTAAHLWTLGVDYIQGDFVQRPSADLDFDFHAAAL